MSQATSNLEAARENVDTSHQEISQSKETPSRAISVLAIAMIACLAVWYGWRPGFVLAPTDSLRLVAPWGDPAKDYVRRNEGLLDQAVQFVPWTIYAVDRLKKHQIPLWNPYSQLGAPFLANGQSAIFYPTMLLHILLSPTWSWTLAAALKLFSAGLGTWFLVGRYGLRGWPRLLSAISFMLCGFNVVWLNHPLTNVSALLPWAIFTVEMLLDRVTLHRILGASLIFAIQFFGGHPGTTTHLLLTCGLVWLLRIILSPPRRPRALPSAAALLISILLGFAMAAAQWLPLLEYIQHSGAKILRTDRLASAEFIQTDPRYLVGLLFPYANGFPDGISSFQMRRATMLPNTNELVPGWVGTIPLVLGIFAAIILRRRNATVKMWLIIGLFAGAIAIAFPLLDNIVRIIPGLRLAQNARLLLTTALALSILAGFGLDELMRRASAQIEPRRLRKLMLTLACIALGFSVIGTVALLATKEKMRKFAYHKADEEYQAAPLHEHTLPQIRLVIDRVQTELLFTSLRLLIPAAMLAVGAMLLNLKNRHKLAPGLMGLAIVDLLAFAIPYNPGAPKETYFPSNVPAIQKLKALPQARIAGTFRTMMPETSTAFRLADLRGYDALGPARYYRWWEHADIGQMPEEWCGYLLQLRNPEHRAWSLLNFGYVIAPLNQPPPAPEKFELLSRGDDAAIYRAKNIRPRAWLASRFEKYQSLDQVLDRVAKMDFDPDEVVLLDGPIEDAPNPAVIERFKNVPPANGPAAYVEFVRQKTPEVVSILVSHGGGWLVLADSYFPGWTATIIEQSGKEIPAPIYPAYGIMRAVPLPPIDNAFVVEFRYRPLSWRIGSITSASAWGLFAILSMAALVMRGLRLRRS